MVSSEISAADSIRPTVARLSFLIVKNCQKSGYKKQVRGSHVIFMSNFVLPYEMIMLLVYIIYGLEFLSSFPLAGSPAYGREYEYRPFNLH